jgi:hypothetical protein
MSTDEHGWETARRDADAPKVAFDMCALLFIGRGFSTVALCGKTYGNVFNGNGCGEVRCAYDFAEKGSKMNGSFETGTVPVNYLIDW